MAYVSNSCCVVCCHDRDRQEKVDFQVPWIQVKSCFLACFQAKGSCGSDHIRINRDNALVSYPLLALPERPEGCRAKYSDFAFFFLHVHAQIKEIVPSKTTVAKITHALISSAHSLSRKDSSTFLDLREEDNFSIVNEMAGRNVSFIRRFHLVAKQYEYAMAFMIKFPLFCSIGVMGIDSCFNIPYQERLYYRYLM